ncbi:MAG TPA: STAS domain-containing protein [Pyrinomonadaceae bacterium]
MKNLNITERRSDLITILDLAGNIRLGDGSAELHEALRLLVEKGAKAVLLNMANVAHIDSSGLGELVSAYTTLHRAGGELKLFNLSDRAHELMTMTKLLTVFDVYDNESEAIQSFNDKSSKSTFSAGLM